VINHGGEIIFAEKICHISINGSYRYQEEIMVLLERLRNHFKLAHYRFLLSKIKGRGQIKY